MTTSQALELALQYHQTGRLAEAETLYRQILAVQPAQASALHHLGVIAHQRGRPDLAVEWIRQALAAAPGDPIAHCDLGEAYRAMGRVDDAMAAYRDAITHDPACAEAHANLGVALSQQRRFAGAAAACRRALELKPDNAIFHYNLGNALRELGSVEEAVASFQRALQLKPDFALAENNLGNALKQGGRPEEAIVHFRHAVELRPDYALAWFNLGNGLMGQGRFGDAIAAFQQAVRFKPDEPEIWNNLGGALLENAQPEEAATAYRRVLQLKPDYAEVHSNLGKALGQLRQFDEAIASCRRAVALKPTLSTAWIDLGNGLKEEGRLEEALDAYRRARESNPEDAVAQSNVIYALHFRPGNNEAAIAGEQQRWNQRFSTMTRPAHYAHEPHPERRLRIGYVSPEFRDHVTGRYLMPLFRHHDRRNFEILCYSGVIHPDSATEEFRRCTDRWRATKGVADEAVADMIRADGVDILVDLTQHLADNRLPVFARQPAPVQVSFAGYPASTGVEAIGCRISDRYLEEDWGTANDQVFFVDTFWCYDPCGLEVPVGPAPAQDGRPVIFGCLNNFCKVNEPVLKLWARLLREIGNSQLILLSPHGSHRQSILALLEREGVASQRVEMVEMRSRVSYLELYHRLDVALDPFPYQGHTTSLDALWMGVPVVSLAGRPAVSRAGLSQLSNLGLPELAAYSEEDYVRIATEIAGDLPKRKELRHTLRARMEASPLMDAPRFARQIEAAYRTMWRQWCAQLLSR